jgi:hypothetical protein
VSGTGSGTRRRPQGFQQVPHAGLLCGQPLGAGEAEVSQGGGEGDGGGILLDEFSEFLGGAEIGLMDDAWFTVDAGAFDEVVENRFNSYARNDLVEIQGGYGEHSSKLPLADTVLGQLPPLHDPWRIFAVRQTLHTRIWRRRR